MSIRSSNSLNQQPAGPRRTWDLTEGPVANYTPVDRKGYAKSNSESAIIIDNGSYNVRAGWSFDRDPRLSIPPLMARYRDRKQNRMLTLVGHDVYADGSSRGQARNVFEAGNNVVYNWDVMEGVLDYVFTKLGIEADKSGGIGRPVVMTEPMANPAYPRKTMSEILFECYGATSVAYGIDSLFSYKHNGGRTGIVTSSSYSSTHVVPVIDSKPIFEQAARLNWGRSQSIEYMLKLLRVKYPSFPGKLNENQVGDLIREHCHVSTDYPAEVSKYFEWTGLEDRDHIIQHPYVEPVIVHKSEEELAAAAAKRKEGGRRLQEQSAKLRLEKLIQKEKDLQFYKGVQEQMTNAPTKKETKRILESNNFEHEAELERMVRDLERSIKRSRNKDVGDADEEEDEPQTFPLIDVSDDQLDEEGLKQKKLQRLQKAGYDARQRAKAEKAREVERLAELERLDVQRRENDVQTWAEEKRKIRQQLLQRIKERDQAKSEMSNRKSATNQMRMRTLTNLAFDAPVKKRRRGGGEDDSFGADDADWDVYRSARGGGNQSDEEDEDDLEVSLSKLEADLLAHDPNFTTENLYEAETDWSRSLLHLFTYGPYPHDPESTREQHQIHLNVERIRVPEVLFQPPMAGVDQAGLTEIVAMVLNERFSGHARQSDLLKDIFLTGGNVGLTGLYDRVLNEIRATLPIEAPLRVRSANDVVGDAWRGAAGWAEEERRKGRRNNRFITRDEYLEKGSDYIKEHECGNAY